MPENRDKRHARCCETPRQQTTLPEQMPAIAVAELRGFGVQVKRTLSLCRAKQVERLLPIVVQQSFLRILFCLSRAALQGIEQSPSGVEPVRSHAFRQGKCRCMEEPVFILF